MIRIGLIVGAVFAIALAGFQAGQWRCSSKHNARIAAAEAENRAQAESIRMLERQNRNLLEGIESVALNDPDACVVTDAVRMRAREAWSLGQRSDD